MYLLSWILVGLVAGWLGGKILKGDGYGTVMDIAMGIGGAVAGGLLMQSAGLGGRWGAISTTVVLMAPQRPPRPADCMRRPPATAPPMPIAMSMTVPYPSPLRIFPPNQPATNPTRIHDKRYIQFSFY